MGNKDERKTAADEQQAERLERVRSALADGTYRPDPEAIADAMQRSAKRRP
jgi:anti-sigma28 factor (negative regulator of flagellin synthesis)